LFPIAGFGGFCIYPNPVTAVLHRSEQQPTFARGPMLTVDTALADTEELRTLVQEGHDKGYLTYDEVASTLEEVELSKEQLEDFYTYLLDHNIELLDADSKQTAQGDAALHGEKAPELEGPA